MYALIDISNQMLEDSGFDMEGEIRGEALPLRPQRGVGAVVDVPAGPSEPERHHDTKRHPSRAPRRDVAPVEGAQLRQLPPRDVRLHFPGLENRLLLYLHQLSARRDPRPAGAKKIRKVAKNPRTRPSVTLHGS